MSVGFIGGKYLPLHQGHVFAIMKASSMVDKLYVVLSSSEKRDSKLCFDNNIKYANAEIRLSWLGELVHDLENIEIIHIVDNYGVFDYEWKSGCKAVKKAIKEDIDYVFSSEQGYDDIFKTYYPRSKHIVIDDNRCEVPISATEIRENLYKHWDKIPSYVRSFYVKKVAVVGTKSCGKSTLVKKLAKSYNTNYCLEVGRNYCEKYSNHLTPEMFNKIAMEHYILQEKLINESNKILFVDSEVVITRYYLRMYLKGIHDERLLTAISNLQNYDLVLYLEPDVEWVDDGTRFAAENRLENNIVLKKMYGATCQGYFSIDGNYNKRFDSARKFVNEFLKN
jgi:HTH-type transcriptional repressor of NAD biosynthesis genes